MACARDIVANGPRERFIERFGMPEFTARALQSMQAFTDLAEGRTP